MESGLAFASIREGRIESNPSSWKARKKGSLELAMSKGVSPTSKQNKIIPKLQISACPGRYESSKH